MKIRSKIRNKSKDKIAIELKWNAPEEWGAIGETIPLSQTDTVSGVFPQDQIRNQIKFKASIEENKKTEFK